jgi:hypothetical protein
MQKVLTGRSTWRAIRPTMVLESTPPDRKAPKGTSARNRMRVASSSRAMNSAAQSSKPKSCSRWSARLHQRRVCTGAPRVNFIQVPASHA